jgi:hypothetical protein
MNLRLVTWLEQRWNWITLGATATYGSEGPCAWPNITGSTHVLYGMWALCSGVTDRTEDTDMRTFWRLFGIKTNTYCSVKRFL